MKICKRCNKEFNRERSEYCSRKCGYGKPIKEKTTLQCSHCNKEFHKFPSQVKSNKDTIFCGNQCVIDYRKIHWKGKVDRICTECGKDFKIYQSEFKKAKNSDIYCSKKCQANGHEIRECLICNKQFKAYKSNIKRGNALYCSKSCAGKAIYKDKSCFQWLSHQERFFMNISKENHPNNCWEWTGLKNKAGYGRIRMEYSDKTAHRYSWEWHFGDIPEGILVCHKCDNPSCVNPQHLFSGTHLDNNRDRDNKNRRNPPKGSSHTNAKLDENKILEIRKHLKDKKSITEIAIMYDVSWSTIKNIFIGKIWKHVL